MPGGDAQRVWFPEMLNELKRMWLSAMTWEELADFYQRITEKRKSIRHEGNQAATHTMPQVRAGIKVGHIGSLHSISPVRLEE